MEWTPKAIICIGSFQFNNINAKAVVVSATDPPWHVYMFEICFVPTHTSCVLMVCYFILYK